MKLDSLFKLGGFISRFGDTLSGWALPVAFAIDTVRFVSSVYPQAVSDGAVTLEPGQQARLEEIQKIASKIFPCHCAVSDGISDQPKLLGSQFSIGLPTLFFPSRFVTPRIDLARVTKAASEIDELPLDPLSITADLNTMLLSDWNLLQEQAHSYTDDEISYLIRLEKEKYDHFTWLTRLGQQYILQTSYQGLHRVSSPTIARFVETVAPRIARIVSFISLPLIKQACARLMSATLFQVCLLQNQILSWDADRWMQDFNANNYKARARLRKREFIAECIQIPRDYRKGWTKQKLMEQDFFRMRNSAANLRDIPQLQPEQSTKFMVLRTVTRVSLRVLGLWQIIRQLHAISRLFRQQFPWKS